MLDDLSYGARIEMHSMALIELFSQIRDNRNIYIRDISITRLEGADWKDFILHIITINNSSLEEVFSNEDRPLTNEELKLMTYINGSMDFKDIIVNAGVWPDFLD